MGSDHSKKPQSILPSSFQSLPYEIREQIWLYTLLPRLIYIHPHQRLEPHPYDHESNELVDGLRMTASVRFNHSLHTTSSTPAEAFASYASFVVPDPHYVGRMDGEFLNYEHKLAVQPLAWRGGQAPPALHVCGESRAIALRKGYVLAFKGVDLRLEEEDKEYWKNNHLSDKGIWVNFSTDLIMLDALYRSRMYPKWAPLQPLVVLNKWAPEDVKRIRYLALGGNPGMVLSALRGNCVPVPHGPRWRTEWQWWVSLGYDNLEEIWIDDEFEVTQKEKYYEVSWRDWECQKGAAEQCIRAISMGRSKLPHWTSPLPEVKVVRGKDWRVYFGD
ncbi:uncharacterized protein LY89DRAFT_740773 [Mollisia scopiformis]|uniref:2EXR domain-containing protein n=1 Tax=Mollisia scopiformis TaxID=149040 RepID=A0A132BDG2_MOLSC|nr:uncharacterized protein LY89DRAFT_740773 [Mollisia scopiformis]KUJ09697.1 hypothetical protein LY89DRAFT_740773 [Mollisia scopiformis]